MERLSVAPSESTLPTADVGGNAAPVRVVRPAIGPPSVECVLAVLDRVAAVPACRTALREPLALLRGEGAVVELCLREGRSQDDRRTVIPEVIRTKAVLIVVVSVSRTAGVIVAVVVRVPVLMPGVVRVLVAMRTPLTITRVMRVVVMIVTVVMLMLVTRVSVAVVSVVSVEVTVRVLSDVSIVVAERRVVVAVVAGHWLVMHIVRANIAVMRSVLHLGGLGSVRDLAGTRVDDAVDQTFGQCFGRVVPRFRTHLFTEVCDLLGSTLGIHARDKVALAVQHVSQRPDVCRVAHGQRVPVMDHDAAHCAHEQLAGAGSHGDEAGRRRGKPVDVDRQILTAGQGVIDRLGLEDFAALAIDAKVDSSNDLVQVVDEVVGTDAKAADRVVDEDLRRAVDLVDYLVPRPRGSLDKVLELLAKLVRVHVMISSLLCPFPLPVPSICESIMRPRASASPSLMLPRLMFRIASSAKRAAT